MTTNETPQLIIPDGFEYLGYHRVERGMGYINHLGAFTMTREYDHLYEELPAYSALCFRKLEPVDQELEDARKKFPVGSWFKSSAGGSTIHKVERVDWENLANCVHELCIRSDDCRGFLVSDCTPFPLPVWRCCETDRPKKERRYPVRLKKDPFNYDAITYHVGIRSWNWIESNRVCKYEWLDEGGYERARKILTIKTERIKWK